MHSLFSISTILPINVIWTPPDVQRLFGVMNDRLGCRFISGLLCKP
jgi:predicted P-loop ATPase/GTPase